MSAANALALPVPRLDRLKRAMLSSEVGEGILRFSFENPTSEAVRTGAEAAAARDGAPPA